MVNAILHLLSTIWVISLPPKQFPLGPESWPFEMQPFWEITLPFTPSSFGSAVLCLVAHSCLSLCDPMECSLPGSSIHGDSPGKTTGVGCCVLRTVFQTQGSNPGLPHCRQVLYHLRHQGSPRILEWVAYPFSRGSSQPRDQAQVSRIADGFFTLWATREAHEYWSG